MSELDYRDFIDVVRSHSESICCYRGDDISDALEPLVRDVAYPLLSKIADLRAALAKVEEERDALKAQAKRLAVECIAWRFCDTIFSQHAGDRFASIRAARAAVDAHGDLEVPK